MSIIFDNSFSPNYGKPVLLDKHITRITAQNPSALTFAGSNTYIIGGDSVAVLDPGPDNADHYAALVAAIGGRPVSHILLTHGHADHAALAPRIAAHFHAPIAAGVNDTTPTDIPLGNGDKLNGGAFKLTAIATPGHTADHFVFALDGTGCLFSGDHVMAWSTTMIAPPEGVMKDYMTSLDAMLARGETIYYPGHGGPVLQPAKFVRALKTHRKMRERAIAERIVQGDITIDAIMQAIYPDIRPQLYEAAALSVLAHLYDLIEKGVITATDIPPQLDSHYFIRKS